MANNGNSKEKEPSVLEKTLLSEDIQLTNATNRIKANPFKYGSQAYESSQGAYDAVMKGEEITKIRQGAYDSKKAEYQKLGVSGEPSYVSDSDVSALILKQTDEVIAMAKLGDLYNVIKKVDPSLDIKIPEKVKNISQLELMKKAVNEKGEFDEKKLTKEEKIAFSMINLVSEAYKEAIVNKVSQNEYYTSMKEAFKQMTEELEPKEDKSKIVQMNPAEQEQLAEAA